MRSLRRSRIVAALCLCVVGAAWTFPLPADARSQPIDLRVTVALVPGTGSTLHYHGSFTGAPFGSGATDVTTTLNGSGSSHLTFTLSTRKGSVRGSADATITYRGDAAICRGTARIDSGTGSYSRYRARGLRISGTTSATAEKSTLRLIGTITT
jgi:hypothetical protein